MDRTGNRIEVVGESAMMHDANVWRLTGVMRLKSDPPQEIRNAYEIVPFNQGSDTTSWESVNPALGKLIGQFTLFEGVILSLYHSTDGKFSGTEYLRKIDDLHYENKGALYQDKKKLSSWEVTLTRQ